MRSTQSSYRDRTQEFQGIAETLKKSVANAPSSSSSHLDGSRSAVSIQSEFNKRASKIGYGIHQTSQKLAKLAKRTSVFDDPTVEIQELTAVIKQDITALNSAVVDLQLLCNSQNESRIRIRRPKSGTGRHPALGVKLNTSRKKHEDENLWQTH